MMGIAFRMRPGLSIILGFVLVIPGVLTESLANDKLDKMFSESTMSGAFRWYNYTRYNDEGTARDDAAMAVGGDFLLKTGSLAGFSAGLGIYTAHNIDIYDHLNEVLIGPNSHLTAIPQGYLQYQHDHVLVRAGRQLIDTPWARPDMFTMLPRSFYGVVATVAPLPGTKTRDDYQLGAPLVTDDPKPYLVVFVSRMSEFYESRFASDFSRGNRYSDLHNDGFFMTGARYRRGFGVHRFQVEGWFYDFYDYATLGYFEFRYQTAQRIRPLVGFQSVVEGNSGQQRLGPVKCHVWGALAGVGFPHGSATLVGNWSPVFYDTFRHGGMVHPYNDLSGTYFTDTMNDGMGDIGPGHAYGVKGLYDVPQLHFAVSAAYIRYLAKYGFGGAAYGINGPYGFPEGTPVPDQKQYGLDVGVVYTFWGPLKGLTVEDHVGFRNYPHATYGPFIDNRFALIYAF